MSKKCNKKHLLLAASGRVSSKREEKTRWIDIDDSDDSEDGRLIDKDSRKSHEALSAHVESLIDHTVSEMADDP